MRGFRVVLRRGFVCKDQDFLGFDEQNNRLGVGHGVTEVNELDRPNLPLVC